MAPANSGRDGSRIIREAPRAVRPSFPSFWVLALVKPVPVGTYCTVYSCSSRVIGKLQRTLLSLSGGPEALQAIRDLQFPRGRPVGPRGHEARGVEPYPELSFGVDHLMRALGERMPRLSACHVDGWRFEHMRDLCIDPEVREIVVAVLHRMASGICPRASRFLRTYTAIAFPKGNPKREAAMRGEWVWEAPPTVEGGSVGSLVNRG